jgi:hypothetical protein
VGGECAEGCGGAGWRCGMSANWKRKQLSSRWEGMPSNPKEFVEYIFAFSNFQIFKI